MAVGVLDSVSRLAGWVTGPIFGKELRVSSRRRRNYVLRFFYLVVLSVFVVAVWGSLVGSRGGSGGYRVYRMAEIGKTVIGTIVWFQFIALQMLAVVMLSTAISDEVEQRTLAVLATTPVRTFQIVLGKLLSKLLQLLILLAISLPLLAVVRVFGGVPWNFVLAGVCITLTACMVAGAVSMFFSALFRRAYVSILCCMGVGFVLYAVLPMILGMIFALVAIPAMMSRGGPGAWLQITWAAVSLTNPFAVLGIVTSGLASPGAMPFIQGPGFWTLHCGIMLAISVLALWLCGRVVRKAVLRAAMGDTEGSRPVPQAAPSAAPLPAQAAALPAAGAEVVLTPVPLPVPPPVPLPASAGGEIRRIAGSPVLWRELRVPLTRSIVKKAVGISLPLSIVGLTYLLVGLAGGLGDRHTHAVYVSVYVAIGMTFMTVLPATAIAGEKQSRCWPLLLTTPLSDVHILLAKAAGVCRRCWPGWFLLWAHLVVFTCIGLIHPVAMVHLGMLVTGVAVFLTGSGLYFSARFKRTTPAVIANLALAALLWVVPPTLMGPLGIGGGELGRLYVAAHPLVQAFVVSVSASGVQNVAKGMAHMRYELAWGSGSVVDATGLLLLAMAAHCLAGAAFSWRALGHFRRRVF